MAYLQNIDDLKLIFNDFLLEMSKELSSGLCRVANDDYVILCDSDISFEHRMIHMRSPFLPLKPFKESDLYERIYKTACDVYSPLFLSEETPQLVLNTLSSLKGMGGEWYRGAILHCVERCCSQNSDLDAIRRLAQSISETRQRDFSIREGSQDKNISETSKEIKRLYSKMNTSTMEMEEVDYLIEFLEKQMKQQKEMGERMLSKLNSSFQNENVISIENSQTVAGQDIKDRVKLFRAHDNPSGNKSAVSGKAP